MKKYIIDGTSMTARGWMNRLGVSRQRVLQCALKQSGSCMVCGPRKKASTKGGLCAECLKARRYRYLPKFGRQIAADARDDVILKAVRDAARQRLRTARKYYVDARAEYWNAKADLQLLSGIRPETPVNPT